MDKYSWNQPPGNFFFFLRQWWHGITFSPFFSVLPLSAHPSLELSDTIWETHFLLMCCCTGGQTQKRSDSQWANMSGMLLYDHYILRVWVSFFCPFYKVSRTWGKNIFLLICLSDGLTPDKYPTDNRNHRNHISCHVYNMGFKASIDSKPVHADGFPQPWRSQIFVLLTVLAFSANIQLQ